MGVWPPSLGMEVVITPDRGGGETESKVAAGSCALPKIFSLPSNTADRADGKPTVSAASVRSGKTCSQASSCGTRLSGSTEAWSWKGTPLTRTTNPLPLPEDVVQVRDVCVAPGMLTNSISLSSSVND